MKNLTLKFKLSVIAVLSLFAFSGILLGASNIAKADATVEPASTMSVPGTSLYLSDEEADEGVDVNGIRFAFKISTATYGVISSEEYEAGVFVCPTSLLPDGFEATNPSTFVDPFVKASFALSTWEDYDGGKAAYVVLYDIPEGLYDEEFTVIGYYYDGEDFHLTTVQSETMANAASKYIAANRATADETWEAVLAKYATTYEVVFIDANEDEVASGLISSREQPINILSHENQQKGWLSASGVNARALIEEDTTFYYEAAYCSYDEEGGAWYDTLGTAIFLGNDAKNKGVIVTFDMLVDTVCTDFAILNVTNGVKLLDSALDSSDYSDWASYSIRTVANADGEIVVSVGDWHSSPQRTTLFIDNVEYEVADLTERSTQNNHYVTDFVVIPTELPVGTYVSGSVKIAVDKYSDDYVSTTVKTVETLWGDNSLRATTDIVAYANITGSWQTVEFETTVVGWTSIKQNGSSTAVDLSGNNIIIAVGTLKDVCELTVYKDASIEKLYSTGNSSIQTKDGYGQYFAAIPVDSDIADVGEEVDVEIDIMIDTYSDAYVTPVLYKVDSISNSQVSTKTQVLAAASITDDTWQTVTFRATVLNASSVAAYGANGSTATFSGNYVLLVYTTTKNTTNLIKFKDPTSMTKFVKDWEDAERSYQSNDKYGGDVIFIPVEGEGRWTVSMSIKAPSYSDAYVSNAIKYVSTVWSDNSLNSTTTIVAHADITGDWQDIEFTAPAVNFSSIKVTGSSSAVTAPNGYYVAVVIERIKITEVDVVGYKNVEVTEAPAQAVRSYQSNNYGSDYILIPVDGAGDWEVTLDVKADKYYDQYYTGRIDYVTTVWGDNSVNSVTTVVAHDDMVDDAWNNDITFTAPAVNFSSLKDTSTSNEISTPSGYFVAVRVRVKNGVSALTEYRNVVVEKAPENAVRSKQSDNYGSDFILISVPTSGNYTVTLDIKADSYYDQYFTGDIQYVSSVYANNAVYGTTVVVAHDDMVDDDWNEGITFTAPAINATGIKHSGSANEITAPSTWYIAVRVKVKNGVSATTLYKNVEVVGTAQRSFQSNDKYGSDVALLYVSAAGSYNVTMKIKAPIYSDQYVSNAVKTTAALYANNAPNGSTTIVAHADITGDWQEISFTATAISATGFKHSGNANEITAPGTYFIALYCGTVKTSVATTAMQFKDVVITAAA